MGKKPKGKKGQNAERSKWRLVKTPKAPEFCVDMIEYGIESVMDACLVPNYGGGTSLSIGGYVYRQDKLKLKDDITTVYYKCGTCAKARATIIYDANAYPHSVAHAFYLGKTGGRTTGRPIQVALEVDVTFLSTFSSTSSSGGSSSSRSPRRSFQL